MNNKSYTISAYQRAELAAYIKSDDRVGFYIALHNMTGSEAALDMAEISSSSGLRGGIAWSLNSAYAKTLEGYPKEGVSAFSRAIAQGALNSFQPNSDGSYSVPSDIETYKNAKAAWNDVGKEYGVPDLGDKYFPGNTMIAQHYMLAGKPIDAWDAAGIESYIATGVGAGMAFWEALTEVVADGYNYTKSLNEFMAANAGSTLDSFTSEYGAKLTILKDADGKTIGVIRADGPFGMAGKFTDSMNFLLAPYAEMLNELGRWIGQNVPTAYELDGLINSLFTSARAFTLPRDPLVLDLDGDGLELSPASGNLLFDNDADGIKTGTGWAGSDDGFLVRDLNGNGLIDSGRELFGDSTLKRNGQLARHGFDALADLDSNADGQITSADVAWSELQVWRDLNQDGISQRNELSSLNALNISRIGAVGSNTGPQAGAVIQNNRVALSASYTRAGVNRNVGAIDLDHNPFFSDIPPQVVDEAGSPITLTPAALALPQMNGSGIVRNLGAPANDDQIFLLRIRG